MKFRSLQNVSVKIVLIRVALIVVGTFGMATTGFCPPARGLCPLDATIQYKPNVLNLKSMIRLACPD